MPTAFTRHLDWPWGAPMLGKFPIPKGRDAATSKGRELRYTVISRIASH